MRFVVAVLIVFALGCQADSEQPAQQPDPVPVPLRLIVLQDVSVSTHNIPRVSVDHLNRVVEYIRQFGGEIIITTVGSSSPPMVRLRLEPPVPPLSVTARNAFRATRQQAQIDRERATYDNALAEYRASADATGDELPLVQRRQHRRTPAVLRSQDGPK